MWKIVVTITVLSAIAAGSEMSFTCDFEDDTCGFTNQEGLTALWERREMELEGKTGYMMVFQSNDSSAELAKMMTPYFEIDEDIPGCLSFDLYVSGKLQFEVQQETNFGIITLWSVNMDGQKGWKKPRMGANLDESTRFFFKVVFNGLDAPVAAVDNIQLDLKKC